MTALDRDDWQAIQELFDELVDLPPDAQTQRLAASTRAPEIISAVRGLLTASRGEGILDLSPPQLGAEATMVIYTSLAAGQGIGGFEIERLIGRGGLGEVYLARRAGADFDQRVALKLLRVDAAERAESFARERRLLARLDHPGIARLIDAGVAHDGRPYIVMDYVDGEPIDAWCRSHAADLDTRLRLFRETCEAVAYAHANLVVHRDIKPSNILIDPAGKPRLVDFGIGKLLDDSAALPATTQAMLTPDYAAPEQLDGDEATVSTDVYALGVVLYELVSGKSPWRSEKSSVPAMIRRILYEDAALPSRAAAGATPVPASKIGGDLDAIVMKAMRRNPAERYLSVSALAEDVARHQQFLPVQARDGSTRYMAGRFLRRYRWGVAATAAVLAALLVGAGGIAWQARATAIERDAALAEAKRSEAINRLLTVMLRDTAATDEGQTATVKQMLDHTANKLANSLDHSAESAVLVSTLFNLYVNLEDNAGSYALVSRALERGVGSDSPAATADLMVKKAAAAAVIGNTDEMPKLLAYAERVFTPDPVRYRLEIVELKQAQAQYLRRTGKTQEAIDLLVATLPDAEVVWKENHRDVIAIYNNILVYMIETSQLDAMPPIFARADALIARSDEKNSPSDLNIRQLKALRLIRLGKPAEAEPLLRGIVAQRRATLGESAGLAVDLVQLSRAQVPLGKYADARKALEEAYPMAAENLSPKAMPTIIIGASLAEARAETGDIAGAQALITQLQPLFDAVPPGVPTAVLGRARAVLRLKQGRIAEARKEITAAEALFRQAGPGGESYLKSAETLRKRIDAAG
ncbi:serine/threonine-protein kinase [Sphingopyxis sp.]|jgi:non-specific serine/threonine protein kinase/serine/threonine-protein kinase|uniref:serine/threonine-protein kinase n=1 Tax=Sphingopyxis sp. TaxID=1908224 RepID=UPI002DE33570|nr:serine/threonine-protein kinase [Sphingopyxis sp.]